ncbi:hypothetical protein N7537_010870 [Penicillium hordei]|uniref:BZIP domain-containing protein n=1 Tax=Penicillium hordei TaxID=40994 RepID=A0AAD6DM17_9EURO|nr:uncharacterized protein N7537_010870 [Penicillium hordei]KAJ5588192.1 hypothetical protein N7537_010870 [Penicillium hordei]
MEGVRTWRRGRPRIQDEKSVNDVEQMRLAQRSYRARKEKAQQSEKIRAQGLNSALDDTFEIFSTLHQRIVNTSQIQNTPDILLHLNDASRQMAAIASSCNKDLQLQNNPMNMSPSSPEQAHGTTSQPPATDVIRGQDKEWRPQLPLAAQLPASYPLVTRDSRLMAISLRTKTSSKISLPARFIRACFKRAVTILSSSAVHGSQQLVLTLPLQWLGKDAVIINSLQVLESFLPSVADFQYPLHSAPGQPHMYRVVEGGTKTLPRAPAPLLQRIAKGRTRTMLDTHFLPLQGEWLEAVDVEEYLEERGIYIRDAIRDDMTSTDETLYENIASGIEQNTPVLAPSSTPSQLDVSLSTDFRGHEASDYSVFGLPWVKPLTRSANGQPLPNTIADVPSTELSSVPQSSFKPQATQIPTKASQINVDLDKLIHLLAENAMCLGPTPGIRKAAVDASIRGSVILS